LNSLKSTIHNEQYKQEILLYENSYILSCTKYEKYPVIFFENDEFCIYLEGKIYGKDYSDIIMELNNFTKYIFYNRNDLKENVAKWLLNTDGDFIIFILSKISNEIFIINDALGRLPLYYHNEDGELLVSRELKFITNLIDNKEFDRMSIAQYLLPYFQRCDIYIKSVFYIY
jgi:asparagine synthase (glutamine-hydrolysing)